MADYSTFEGPDEATEEAARRAAHMRAMQAHRAVSGQGSCPHVIGTPRKGKHGKALSVQGIRVR